MPTSAARAATQRSLAYRDVLSDDGTRLRAWTNDPDGTSGAPTVLLCNGLGTNPWVWPALLRPDCGVRVVSWFHRGVGGSARPTDPDRVGVEVMVEDALSVMDSFGIDKAVLLGWSIGVNTMFELAAEHPERVRGLCAVAGVPGDTFATMLGPFRVPMPVAKVAVRGLSRALKLGGRAVTPVTSRLPVGTKTIGVLSHTGFMFPMPDQQAGARAVAEFLRTPVDWYFHSALRASEHPRVSLSRVKVPAVFISGRYDLMAGHRHLASAAERMDDATYVELRGSHFLPLEQPDEVHRHLLELINRAERAERAERNERDG
ncbi:alpha/beta fold hydrolase [Nocardioides ferulae]|uniref:alpha/beta fold hydrolase n=1 Tax=Nocardioides ferulae TaxID=2340821 RepID=UPI000EB53325|nr:alpha/beta hydrolase [Nocardioides ferulae]